MRYFDLLESSYRYLTINSIYLILSGLYVPGVSEQRLREARYALERAEVTGSIQEFLGRRAA